MMSVKRDESTNRKEVFPSPGADNTFIKGLALGGHDAFPAAIDVKNGKILRIRPLHLDWKYDQKEFNPWQIKVRGQVFKPDMR